jgi:ABC-type uncharacterized transport system auxiliary subunit
MESWLLEASSPIRQEATTPVFSGVLKIRYCRATPPFDGQHFLYKAADGRYEQDFYRQFLTPPNEQVAELLRTQMENSGLFGNVIPASSAVDPDYTLEPQLLAIYTDFSDAMNPKTVIKINVVLLHLNKNRQDSAIVLEKTYQRSETFQEKTGKSIISGYNAGLETIFSQLVEDIREKGKSKSM